MSKCAKSSLVDGGRQKGKNELTSLLVSSALVLVVVEMALNVRDWAREDVFVLCWSWPSARSRVANGIAAQHCGAAAASLLPLRRWTGWWRWTNPSWRGAQLHAAAAALPLQPPPPAPCQSPAHIAVQKTIPNSPWKMILFKRIGGQRLTTDVSKLELLLSLRGNFFRFASLRAERDHDNLDLSINQGMDHVCHRQEQALSRWKPILFQVHTHTWKEKARQRQREGQAARKLDLVYPPYLRPGDATLFF